MADESIAAKQALTGPSLVRTACLRVRAKGFSIVPQTGEEVKKGIGVTISRFGRQQFRIMLVLWEKGRATAREITEALNQHEPIAHSTVQTLLRQLEKKGAITHDVEDRTFIFRPLRNQEKVRGNATREIVGRLFDDSPGELVSHLLEHEEITAEEREEIRAILEELAKKSEKNGDTDRKEE